MNGEQAEAMLRMVNAAWPTPQMTDDEGVRWAARFADVEFDECADALLALEKVKDRRPSWSDVWREIQEVRRRDEPVVQAAVGAGMDTYREIGMRNIARIREEWALASRKSLRLDDDPRAR